MKTITTIILILPLLLGCQRVFLEDYITSSPQWFDQFGNEYKFEDGKLSSRPIGADAFRMVLGNIHYGDQSLFINCGESTSNPWEIKAIEMTGTKITFDQSLSVCTSIENSVFKKFSIWNNLDDIIDTEEKLISLQINTPLDYFPIEINNDKSIHFHYNGIDTSFLLNDSSFALFETYLQILPIEKYDSAYSYLSSSSLSSEFVFVTNKTEKQIILKSGIYEHGLSNLIGLSQYIIEKRMKKKNST